VLVIDDNAGYASVVAEGLNRDGYQCEVATSGAAGAKRIEQEDFDLILTDLRMAGIDGLAIVRKVKQLQPEAEVIVITGFAEVPSAVDAIKLGAAHYLVKSDKFDELRAVVGKTAESLKLARANRELRRQLDEKFGFEGVIGNSPKMQQAILKLKAFAPSDARVLILGENGTGKELVAKALHTNSPRKNKPFVALNCTALNENLLDDELFGHEAHAYTGADKLRKGRFEYTNGGTLFLDEIGDMPLSLQAKLLRVLETGEVTRIGSNEPVKVDVRVIAATNRDLEAAVAAGRFRQDLFFRLKVGTIRLPPLRDRREDIPLLTSHFLKELSQRYGKAITGLSDDVRRAFTTYDWPGNVRELRNLIESMTVQDRDGVLGLDDIDEGEAIRQQYKPEPSSVSGLGSLIGRPLSEIERYFAERTLELTQNNREEAAKLLGIGERTLYRMMQDWKLQDRIKQAMTDANDDPTRAAEILGMTRDALERKLKKLGRHADED
jgi:two-component system response regulator HydG